MNASTSKWLHGLLATMITGVSTTGLSLIGTVAIGMTINWKQLAVCCLMSGIVGAFAYLKQSPLPPDEP